MASSISGASSLTSDVQIGAIEVKNAADDTRALVSAANTARTATDNVISIQHIDAAGVVGGVRPTSYATDDSGMPATPAIGPVGGEYRSSATTYTDGDATVLQTDVNGNLKITAATLSAGEDLTNDVTKVEERFSYNAVITADTQIKGSAGFLHSITFAPNDATPTAGSIIVFDSLTETGTQIFNWNVAATAFIPFTVIFDVTFATGLYVGFTTTADVNVSVSYR